MRPLIKTFFLASLLFFPLTGHAQSVPPPHISKPGAHGWWDANRDSTGQAPLPAKEKQAVVQIYYARAWGWRRYFGVHSWIATKDKNADHYTVYQVMGWHRPVVSIQKDLPDRYWYGEKPVLMFSAVGDTAEKMIPEIQQNAKSYDYPNDYVIWPGPNSNSFTSHIIRHTPGITVELPPTAIGKDWIDDGKFFAPSETGTGWQFSFFGLLGLTIGKAEGFEINILGLTFGFDILNPALKLPFIGRIGMKDKPV